MKLNKIVDSEKGDLSMRWLGKDSENKLKTWNEILKENGQIPPILSYGYF